MKLAGFSIAGFGALADLTVDDLSGGLNVLHGPNGSGKTTVVQFLRGMFCGFEEARRRRLLPPLNGGTSGGTVTIDVETGRCTLIRHLRPDQSETLAVSVRDGEGNLAAEVRSRLNALNAETLGLFAVGNSEASAIEDLVHIARRDGIDLTSRRAETARPAALIEDLSRRRRAPFNDAGCKPFAGLTARRDGLQRSIQVVREEYQRRDDQLATEHHTLDGDLQRLEQDVDRRHLELQAAQADVNELEDRAWAEPAERIAPARPAALSPAALDRQREVESINRQIAHAQQVLRDLASTRMRLSLETADLAGCETAGCDAFFTRQRASIGRIERYILRLQGDVEHLQARAAAGHEAADRPRKLAASLNALRHQVYGMCQELSRHESRRHQELLLSERDGVDRCEAELRKQIERLMLRRDELIDGAEEENACLASRTQPEAAFCECREHESFRILQPPEEASGDEASGDDAEAEIRDKNSNSIRGRLNELRSRRDGVRHQWEDAVLSLRAARRRRQELDQQRTRFAADRRLNELEFDLGAAEREIEQAREQWQALALTQVVLTRLKERWMVEEHPPVIREASAHLRRLTEDRYLGFHVEPESHELTVTTQDGTLPLPALSRGTLEQASLSFQIALVGEYARRGLELPLILDDVLIDSDEDRLNRAVELLAELAAAGRQILFLTCREHLAARFESLGIRVRDLPGTHRSRPVVPAAESIEPRDEAAFASMLDSVAIAEAVVVAQSLPTIVEEGDAEDTVEAEERVAAARSGRFHRVHPSEPYWLRADSPVSLVPSIGEQMARRLGGAGLRTVADLIELDPDTASTPLGSLQISASQVRLWQAEARLLCCIPDLTGRDAQLLSSCGIFSAAELAEADAGHLLAKVARLRGTPDAAWVTQGYSWPTDHTVTRWIGNGRRARTFREALDAVARPSKHQLRPHLSGRSSERLPTLRGVPRGGDQPRGGSPASAAATGRDQLTLHRFADGPPAGNSAGGARAAELAGAERQWKFYLESDSPVVDAPSIGSTLARRLEKIGVVTVADLLQRDAATVAAQLDNRRLTAEAVRQWQQQSRLMCRIPELRGHDAQLLVGCGLTEAEEIAGLSPQLLLEIVTPFAATKEGRRVLRSFKTPDLTDAAAWAAGAKQARSLRAA